VNIDAPTQDSGKLWKLGALLSWESEPRDACRAPSVTGGASGDALGGVVISAGVAAALTLGRSEWDPTAPVHATP
jgi:hypothetical protein